VHEYLPVPEVWWVAIVYYTYEQYIENILLDKPRMDQYEGAENAVALFLVAWKTWEHDVQVCIRKLEEAVGTRGPVVE
jgi:hypothetical protein